MVTEHPKLMLALRLMVPTAEEISRLGEISATALPAFARREEDLSLQPE
jgi:hypothetical protein